MIRRKLKRQAARERAPHPVIVAAIDIYRQRHNVAERNLDPQQVLNALTEAGIAAPGSTLRRVVMAPGWRKAGREYAQARGAYDRH